MNSYPKFLEDTANDIVIKRTFYARHKYKIAIGTGILLTILIVWEFVKPLGASATPRQLQSAIPVTFKEFSKVAVVQGKISGDNPVVVASPITGFVSNILVDIGETIEEDQPLLRIESEKLEANIADANDRLSQLESEQDSAQITLLSKRQMHEKRDVELEIEITETEGLLAGALDLAQNGYARKIEITGLELKLDKLKRLGRIEREFFDKTQQLEQAKMASITARLKRAEQALERFIALKRNTTVKAPFPSSVSKINIGVGGYVTTGTDLMALQQLENVSIIADIDEYFSGDFAEGQETLVTISDTTYSIRLAKVNDQIIDGSFSAQWLFKGGRPANVNIGQSVRFEQKLYASEPSLAIPSEYINSTGSDTNVFVLQEDNSVVQLSVTTGRTQEGLVEILSGLTDQTTVVLNRT